MAKQARAPEQKAERRTAIVNAAETLFRDRPFDRLTVADIAGHAGVAKGTVYLYFRSKEDIFLALLGDRQVDGLKAMEDMIDALMGEQPEPAPERTALLAKRMAEAMTTDPLSLRLTSLANDTLEANATFDDLVGYKKRLVGAMGGPASKLAQFLGLDGPEMGLHVLKNVFALALGLGQLSDMSDDMREAGRLAGKPDIFHDLPTGLTEGLGALLAGYAHSA